MADPTAVLPSGTLDLRRLAERQRTGLAGRTAEGLVVDEAAVGPTAPPRQPRPPSATTSAMIRGPVPAPADIAAA